MYRAPDIARAVTVNNRVAHHPPAHPSLEHLHLGGLRRRRRAPRSLHLSPRTCNRATTGRWNTAKTTAVSKAATPPIVRLSPVPEVIQAIGKPAETRPYNTRPERIASNGATAMTS